MTGRVVFWLFVVLAVGFAGLDGYRSIQSGKLAFIPLGQSWYAIDPGSLNLLQAVVERYLHPYLWDPIIFTVLLAPSWAFFGGLAVLVALARWIAAFIGRRSRSRRSVFRTEE